MALGAVIPAGDSLSAKNGESASNSQIDIVNLRAEMEANPEDAKAIAGAHGIEWCQTEVRWAEKIRNNRSAAVCPPEGDCDLVANRNANIPGPSDPPRVIRLKFNVFRMNDGSNPAATQADVDGQVAQLNNDFLPSRIQFEYTTEFINNSAYRSFADAEEFGMKNTYADSPSVQLNVYVVNIEGPYIGVGTFPWDGVALGNLGGTICDDNWFGAGNKTLTHEIGHCLGLWHTHHGVDEVFQCSDCWERADHSNGDISGDFCADTDPTPTNYNCSPPGGTDPCSGQPWGATDPQNYMGYAPDGCYSEFSSQQWGRMHCWISDELADWESGVSFTADVTFGTAPMDVQFTATTNKAVTDWNWDFGDGSGAVIQSPMHHYDDPGVRDVLVEIESTSGPYAQLRKSFIALHNDTLIGADVSGAEGLSVRYDIYANNRLPLNQLRIPFSWSGPVPLEMDSIVTTGLRTDYLALKTLVDVDPFNQRATYLMSANTLGGNPPLAPDTGVVLSVWFTIQPGGSGTTTIGFPTYGSNSPTFVYKSTSYNPTIEPGSIGGCVKAGDPNADQNINIADATYLITRIFNSGPAPVPPNSGDANCDGSVNISDVTFLIAYIFGSGPAPCPCAP